LALVKVAELFNAAHPARTGRFPSSGDPWDPWLQTEKRRAQLRAQGVQSHCASQQEKGQTSSACLSHPCRHRKSEFLSVVIAM